MGCIVYQTNKKTGVMYAYWNESYRDPITRKPTARRTYMGRVDPETKEIVKKAENGKRNRSPVGEHQNKNAADEGTIQRISDLEHKLKEANETITKLRKHIKETEYAVKKIANLATSIPPFSSN